MMFVTAQGTAWAFTFGSIFFHLEHSDLPVLSLFFPQATSRNINSRAFFQSCSENVNVTKKITPWPKYRR